MLLEMGVHCGSYVVRTSVVAARAFVRLLECGGCAL